ncbi:sigma-70 family RNA polymerase sigma factor [Dyadobacter sp. CY107]|uniref:RNA polymerase sigma factor n=1 Tax=Dyadobacter fanqingshengii TaxID=2906443 RepID=UPI001F459E4A|nr:sigma-70 family RNA polymerase sigma factor [Dyadobacter fanqingshengii]MCF2505218.1 sigma-70 family RNA polymerase sigma factor [Dyadobacter fanqingshengii]
MIKTLPNSGQSDKVLWQQLKDGSELALGALIRQYFNPLLNYGLKFIRDEAFVKDCVQEVFIEIWNRRERVTVPDSVRAYLLSSVRKRVLREAYRQQILREEEPADLENNGHFVEFSPEWILIENETLAQTKERIEKVLSMIPKRQREVIYLRYYQNLERDEIAEIMNVNPQSVSNLLQTAYISMREYWPMIILLKGGWVSLTF